MVAAAASAALPPLIQGLDARRHRVAAARSHRPLVPQLASPWLATPGSRLLAPDRVAASVT